jgi:hypothetical protein
MTVEALEPNKQVVWRCLGNNPEWVGTTLTGDFVPADHATVLRFSRNGWKSLTEM